VLLEDGVRGGLQRFLKALEIVDVDSKRSTRDMLPYIQGVRKMFSPLPSRVSHVRWTITQVPLDDLECITQTVVKVGGAAPGYIRIPIGNSILTAMAGRSPLVTK
jgi:antiviral helicase SKI2